MTDAAASKQEAADIDPADLSLIDDRLEDDGLSEDEIWAEMQAAEGVDPAASDAADEGGDGSDAPDDGDTDGGDGDADEGGVDVASADTGKANETAPAKAASADKAGKGDDQKDPWAALPEPMRQEVERLRQADRSHRGRIAAYQREINKLLSDRAAPSTPPQDTGKADDQADYLASDDWKRMKEDYPELAAPMESILAAQAAEIRELKKTADTFGKHLSSVGKQAEQQALNEQLARLNEAHPDWEALAAESAKFGEWLESQPRHIREAAERNAQNVVDWEEAADVIGRYKQHLEKAQTPPADTKARDANPPPQALSGKRQRQLSSSHAAQSNAPGMPSGIPADGDLDKMWEQMRREEERKSA